MNDLRNDEEGLVTTERVAIVLWKLINGECLTTAEIAGAVSLKPDSARRMMNKISRKWPVVQIDGKWELVRK